MKVARSRLAVRMEPVMGSRVRIEVTVLNDRIHQEASLKERHTRLREKLTRSGSKKGFGRRSGEEARVTLSARLEGMRRGLRRPCAEGLSKRFALYLEEATKQAEAIREIKSARTRVDLDSGCTSCSTSYRTVPGQVDLESKASSESVERTKGVDEVSLASSSATGSFKKRERMRPKGDLICCGVSFQVKGVIDGSRRTMKESLAIGRHPWSGLRYPVSSHKGVAKTKTGTRGVFVVYFYQPPQFRGKD